LIETEIRHYVYDMWGKVLHQLSRLLLVPAYAAATVVAAASPLAACPALDHASHAEHPHSGDHTQHHNQRSRSHPGDCLNCCMGTCLLGVSLPVPFNGVSSLAFYGTPVVYASEHSVLTDRSIAPDPAPPKPIS